LVLDPRPSRANYAQQPRFPSIPSRKFAVCKNAIKRSGWHGKSHPPDNTNAPEMPENKPFPSKKRVMPEVTDSEHPAANLCKLKSSCARAI
jgi:hypothetical protein